MVKTVTWLTQKTNLPHKITQMVEGQLPDLSACGYQTAEARGFKAIGEQLAAVYQEAIERKDAEL